MTSLFDILLKLRTSKMLFKSHLGTKPDQNVFKESFNFVKEVEVP